MAWQPEGRAQRAAVHRDNRAQLADELHKLPGKKRNTKKWCRGVPGREHDYQKEYKRWSIQIPGCKSGYWFWKCTKCGREERKLD